MSSRDSDTDTCHRCGLKRRIRHGRAAPICADCVMVARDLGELELWRGAA